MASTGTLGANFYVNVGSSNGLLLDTITATNAGTAEYQWAFPVGAALPRNRSTIPVTEDADAIRSRLAAAKPKNRKPWFRFENAADDAVDLFIYDEITDPFWSEFGFGISAASFATELSRNKGKALTVHINSPGGSVFEGTAIYNLLRGHSAPVHVIVDGIAASIASVIAMAGDTVTMAPHSMLMIHDAWGITMGNAADHEQQAKVLNKLSDNIAAVYAERGDKRVNWRAKMLEETWITDAEAVAWKLADRIDESVPTAQAKFDLSRYANVPECLTCQADADGIATTPTKRSAEQALRDAGFSAREAKVILASGWKDEDARDETDESDQDETLETPTGETELAAATGTVAEVQNDGQEARARDLELMALLI